jgi:hypothetical protein
MDEIKSTDAFAAPEVEVRPGFSPSRFVKVFMQGEVVGRKINLATHQNYASLSFTLKRLGNNYSSKLNFPPHIFSQYVDVVVLDSLGSVGFIT